MAGFTMISEGVTSQHADFAVDVREGLLGAPKRLPCRWFYDAEGSRLFEEICRLPEYYPTRVEREILTRNRQAIVDQLPPGGSLLELGSGNAEKTGILIEDLLRRDGRLSYVAIDIAKSALEGVGRTLVSRNPGLDFHGIAAEYQDGLRRLGELRTAGPRLVLFLGSNIGNFDRPAASDFLRSARGCLGAADRLLVGIDLRKAPGILIAAYDDASGVTARFNLNLLARINRELRGEFDLSAFRHLASYDEDAGRIQMHLASRRRQSVAIRSLDVVVDFEEGERIHTEDSYKYSLDEIGALANASGFRVARQWLDPKKWFSLNLFAP